MARALFRLVEQSGEKAVLFSCLLRISFFIWVLIPRIDCLVAISIFPFLSVGMILIDLLVILLGTLPRVAFRVFVFWVFFYQAIPVILSLPPILRGQNGRKRDADQDN